MAALQPAVGQCDDGQGHEPERLGDVLAEAKYRDALFNTLLLGGIVTAASTVIGVPLAYFTARFDFPFKALIAMLPLTTLIVPEVIAAQTWLMMLGTTVSSPRCWGRRAFRCRASTAGRALSS